MKPKAIVFGCTGQDGSYLCKSLINKNYEVIGTSRKQTPNLSRLRSLDIAQRFKVVRCNLENFEETKDTINRFKPLEIYNLSAQSSVGNSFIKPVETQKSIVNATINILEACRVIGLDSNIFHAGSSEIYGSTKTPADIDGTIDLRSPYATAKYQSYLISEMYRNIYQLNCVTGILFNHESPLRDEKFVIKKIIKTAVRIKRGSKEELTLGDITIRRDWGCAEEYIEAIQLINRSNLNRDYVICSGESHSLQSIIQKVFEELELNWIDHTKISKDLFRSKEIESSYGNANSIKKDLGWEAKTKINDLIKKLISYELDET